MWRFFRKHPCAPRSSSSVVDQTMLFRANRSCAMSHMRAMYFRFHTFPASAPATVNNGRKNKVPKTFNTGMCRHLRCVEVNHLDCEVCTLAIWSNPPDARNTTNDLQVENQEKTMLPELERFLASLWNSCSS